MVIKKLALTEIQKGIYFDCQIDDPVAYNISATLLLEGLDEKHLDNAFMLLLGEQEVLRSSINMVTGLPVMVIHDQVDFALARTDISDSPETQQEQLNLIIKEDVSRAFDLANDCLLRGRLVKLAQQKHALIICIHHIIADGLSLEILKRKLLGYYDKLIRGEPIVLRQDDGFKRFLEQENSKLSKGAYQKQKEFWMQKMQGVEPLALPVDYSVTQHDGGIGKEMRFEISADLLQAVNQLAMEQEVTAFMLLLACFGTLLGQYSQSEDIVISSPFTHRPSFDYEETIGCFVSMLPMRMTIDRKQTFSTILQQVVKELIGAYKNIGYPNNLIMRDSLLVPMPGSPSIFDVSFVYDIYEEDEQQSLKTTVIDQDVVTFPGSMMVVLSKTPEKDSIKIQYKPGIFSDDMIDLLGRRFLKLLEIVIDDVNIKIEAINLLLEGEAAQILDTFNQTAFFPYQAQSIIDVFDSKVAKHPERIALREGERTESYATVNAKSNQLARQILSYGLKANATVGVQLERSIDLVITLLAILKAGCAYVPIDATYPATRKTFIFADASIDLLITAHHLPHEASWNKQFLFIDDPDIYTGDNTNLPQKIEPTSLAYIMYTSGSTGQPKGVMIEHQSVVTPLLDLERRFPLAEKDIFLLKTPFTFDVSGTELFGWFMGEGSLQILAHGGEKNPQLILDEIEKRQITHVNFVPTMFRVFLELLETEANVAKLDSLKWIFVGGEAVTPDILRKFNALNTQIPLENVYGPTECTIWASHYSLQQNSNRANVSIGQPLNEIRWYVVGPTDQMQPIGIPGELCLSGVGLARGYLNRPKLTQEKFAPNPFYRADVDPVQYKKIYRTGDLARWLPNGTIEFLGRIDFQVKLHGIRMELGEIENVLAEYAGITQAVVVVKQAPNKPAALCAYYLSENEIPVGKLKSYLATVLPAYMSPSFFVHKNELPLNSSGKVNRNALIADNDYLAKVDAAYLAPNSHLERLIASAW
ncbi:MAG TPA: amino acid adenylation domain-containing protein, partial [Gammaproteobacteria bacterium]|nr:amino acid adenylation domain-containing protein [Gammaproteobacteria bacterium]